MANEGSSANLGIDLRLWPDDADTTLATYLMTFKDEGASILSWLEKVVASG